MAHSRQPPPNVPARQLSHMAAPSTLLVYPDGQLSHVERLSVLAKRPGAVARRKQNWKKPGLPPRTVRDAEGFALDVGEGREFGYTCGVRARAEIVRRKAGAAGQQEGPRTSPGEFPESGDRRGDVSIVACIRAANTCA